MNALVPTQGGLPVGTQQGNWVWDGTNWVCSPCGSMDGTAGQFPFCPPPGFPPHGCPPWFSGMNSPPWYPGANAGVSFGASPPQNAVRGHFWWNGLMLAIFDGASWVNTTTGQIVPPNGGGGSPPPPSGSVVISATAPGNPFVGMQWWDGSQMRVWDGVQWNVVGPGSAVGPVPTTTLVFSIAQVGYLTISTDVNNMSIVPITAAPQVDTTLGWDPITKRFTPKKAGVYRFEVSGYLTGTGRVVGLLKNDPGSAADIQNVQFIGIESDYSSASDSGWMQPGGTVLMNGSTDFVRLFAGATGGTIYSAITPPMISGWLLP